METVRSPYDRTYRTDLLIGSNKERHSVWRQSNRRQVLLAPYLHIHRCAKWYGRNVRLQLFALCEQTARTMSTKKIVLTGATRGLGRALCERFLNAGHHVAGCGRSALDLDATKADGSGELSYSVVDVSNASAIDTVNLKVRSQAHFLTLRSTTGRLERHRGPAAPGC